MSKNFSNADREAIYLAATTLATLANTGGDAAAICSAMVLVHAKVMLATMRSLGFNLGPVSPQPEKEK